ncbi:MAG TPA: response regulator [Candidatus Nitrosotenuis sp.]|jgi:CheY-like chemotaxis protein|nr:response regulator [Candidatus Nitrosotenuis sp.]
MDELLDLAVTSPPALETVRLKRIYIGEFDPDEALALRETLGGLPECELTFFSDGLELYRWVQDLPPDLLLVSSVLPTLPALALCRLLKFHEEFRHIPLILLASPLAEPDLAQKAAAAGADAVLSRPFEPEALKGLVLQHLGVRR